ncbi:hypothetical protein E8E11_004605 [Didymella keratinophila]|nr:hypothetical protein E8E11_004605 [Didymella keratinophila]
MEHIKAPQRQLQLPAMATIAPSVQKTADISLRNQLESPLLQIPSEVRNEICKLNVISTYENGPISFDSLSVIEIEHRLPWTHVCKQLWTETRMLPFAICAFSFGTGRGYAAFIETTSAEQRDAVRTLTFELMCECGEVTWATNILDEMDDEDEDEGQSDDENETADKIETCFKSAFSNLERLNIENACFERPDNAIVKRWIADLKRNNKGVVLRIKKSV